ncbi:MAG: aldo/keto reductase [Proteobacteria bacterium]|nr:aldo/keto reductase [Pseudomonadota bacterium]
MQVHGVTVPGFMYGTAWKEDATESLVLGALRAGFRALDTANQRKHYVEAAVGQGIARAGIPRDQLFLQSKFTYRAGQDDRLPYDPAAPIAAQVAQSFASSLAHLGTDRLDSFLLHGPSSRDGLEADDHAVWSAMETLVTDRRVALIGISNVSAAQLEALVAHATIAPAFVQNRCYAHRGWDRDVRRICAAHAITYQGFSLLTANRDVLHERAVTAIARRHGRTTAQIVFRFAQQLGMLPLTGTSSAVHMAEDLAVGAFTLDDDEVAVIEAVAG